MDEILQKYLDRAPVAVMVRATLVRTMAGSALEGIFRRHAAAQYTRGLTFTTLIRLMTGVVFRTYPSVHAVYREDSEIPVSVTSVYNKLNGLETAISAGLVAETAAAMAEVLTSLPGAPPEPLPGLRLRTLDGNHLAGTDHRLARLRACGAAARPGLALVVRDGRTGLLSHVVPCEDAYTNELALAADPLSLVEPGDLWMGDRNFCTDNYLGGIAGRGARFLVRHRAGTTLHPGGPETDPHAYPGGAVSEQPVRLGDLECRCILIRLDQPLRDGTAEIRLLSNVPADQLGARRAGGLYRTRWRIESAFQELTTSLRCEVATLGYPRAALFGFALGVVAYNLLVTTRAALASGLGEEVGSESALSSYPMATQVSAVDQGLSIAVPESSWGRFQAMTSAEFAAWLHEVASGVDWRPYRKRPRGPKTPVAVRRTSRGAHRSAARELSKPQE